ncbi:replication protein A 70 kDa DNA-binding subunit B-like [Chenopodium quinoa]|uniref:replication protein A 70 kDa DNA-binding subunit B-like n=1 Tax=Chenopodium quinoa TaxID=63459 RepID=UPI000B78520D|nr:replication protein A 70 kDa DNA-binding subunit B-like [Chenopodium quinoa]
MSNWAEKFNVVGFTALKALTARGFTLTTTMSTRIIHEPEGDRADILREWVKLYPQVLQDGQARVLNIRYPSPEKTIVSIADLRSKKAKHVLQEETVWIKATVQEPDLDRVNAYVGCYGCSKRTNLRVGTPFPCSICKKGDSISAHRVTFKFDATDGTGTMAFTAFNDDTERLFRKSATEIYNIKNTENLTAFEQISNIISTKPFFIKVGLTNKLSRNAVLIWTLKEIEIQNEPIQPPVEGSSSGSSTQQQGLTPTEKLKRLQHELDLETKAHGKQPLVIESEPTADFESRP